MIFTACWIVAVAAVMALSSWFSVQQNATGGKAWFFATWALGVIPLWALISRYSKDLVSDAVIYDSVVAIVYYIALVWFTGQWATLRWWQVAGFLMTLAGTFLVKLR